MTFIKEMKVLWMAVTPDEYELPLAVADTAKGLANMLGVTESNVCKLWHRKRRGNRKCKYYIYRIEVEE